MCVIQPPRPLNGAGAEHESAAAMTIEGEIVGCLLPRGKIVPIILNSRNIADSR